MGTGLLLLGLALFFVIDGYDEPQDALGAFLPLAVSLVSLALGVLALVPLSSGDSGASAARTSERIAWALRGLALLGLVVTVAGAARAQLPWTLGALAPLLVVSALLRDSIRAVGRTQGQES